MAAAVREMRYQRSGAVVGNLAFDLDREVREHELRHAGEPARRREIAAQPTPKVRSVSHVQVRQRQKLSPTAVLGSAAVAVLAVMMLLCYVQLTGLSGDVVALRSELKQLQTENVTLTAQYEQMYDLATVKEAAESAGMAKPNSGQVFYIDLSDGDSAQVYTHQSPGVLSRILTSLNHGIYAVVEYFD